MAAANGILKSRGDEVLELVGLSESRGRRSMGSPSALSTNRAWPRCCSVISRGPRIDGCYDHGIIARRAGHIHLAGLDDLFDDIEGRATPFCMVLPRLRATPPTSMMNDGTPALLWWWSS